MYHLESAKVKLINSPGYWIDADLTSMLIGDIVANYKAVMLTLTNNFISGNLYLDFELVKPIAKIDKTLSQWFTYIGNQALPTTNVAPDYDFKYVKFGDAHRANYTIEPVSSIYNPEVDVSEEDKQDLLLSRNGTDYQAFAKRCLVSINGLLHLCDSTEHGVQVKDGARSARIAGANQVGILSFDSIGEIRCLPITEQMIFKPNNITKMKDRVYLNLDTCLKNKTILLSLGGYLHTLDSSITVIGNGVVTIDWHKIPYVHRYFDGKKRMDLSPLELSETPNNENQIGVDEFFSDEVITRYLLLSQTFFVVVDIPELFVEKTILQRSNLPGLYYTDRLIDVPVQLTLGRVGCYWKRREHGKTCIYVDDNMRINYAFETTDWLNENSIDDSRRVEDPKDYADAFSVVIGMS